MNKQAYTRDLILNKLAQNADEIKKFGVSRIGLFGSYARDEGSPKSDIDFLVEFKPEQKRYRNFYQLSYFLKVLFNTEIDLLTKNSLSPHIGPHILKEVEFVSYD